MGTEKPKLDYATLDVVRSTALIATNTVAESASKFSTWLAAVTCVIFSFLFTYIERVRDFVSITCISWALVFLLASLCFALITRFFSTWIEISIKAQERGWQKGKELADAGVSIDIDLYVSEFLKMLIPGHRGLVEKNIKKLKSGDLLASVRLVSYLGQFLAISTVLQSLMALIAPAVLVAGIRG